MIMLYAVRMRLVFISSVAAMQPVADDLGDDRVEGLRAAHEASFIRVHLDQRLP